MGMKKYTGILTVEAVVKDILEKDEVARNSDGHLFVQVLRQIARGEGIDIDSMSFAGVINNLTALGFPQYETVSRTRRKLQEKYPEFKASGDVKEYRLAAEEEFVEYSKS